MRRSFVVLLVGISWLCAPSSPVCGELLAGVGAGDITPPVGTPSAGYGDRLGAGMEEVHDRLQATALVIDNGESRIALVGVDHLGYDHAMVGAVVAGVRDRTGDGVPEIFLGSSHTHAGGGAFLDIPGLGEILAGKFDPVAWQLYVDGAVDAVVAAVESLVPAKVGIGYGRAEGLNRYRGDWPPKVATIDDLAVVKVTTPAGDPMGVWFNFAAHATVLTGAENMSFSADFVGYARSALRGALGPDVVPVYFNGAQGDVSPAPPRGDDMWARCESMGRTLAASVLEVWHRTEASDTLGIETLRHAYDLEVAATSAGTKLPYDTRPSELGLLVLDDVHAFVAIPGELSTIYDADIRRFGGWLGYEHTSILGLTNDAHGYIITPESWRHRIYESTVSFGGETYGEWVKSAAFALLHALEPAGTYQEDRKLPSSLLEAP
ncbi:MAG: neutral/alkaline non-lysosomal ceramidase N-terminal domain-containing protein [Acidobacteriota bacterium]|nr:neutral/alkaline non-lysosomal ceramidase N-terminal domain-containing protein [Acidobacteriota bacterium]